MRCVLDIAENCSLHGFSLCTAVETVRPLLPSAGHVHENVLVCNRVLAI